MLIHDFKILFEINEIYDNLKSIYNNKIKIILEEIEKLKELKFLLLDDIQNINFNENFIQKFENLKNYNLNKSQKNIIINMK